MTFCNLPDSLDLSGEDANVDPDMLQEILKKADTRTQNNDIKHPNPGKPGDIKRATGPKIVHVPVYKEATPQMHKVWSEVNAASRDILFFALNLAGERKPHLKRFRDNMEASSSLKDILGARLSLANYNDVTQAGVLAINAYLKSLCPPINDDPNQNRHASVQVRHPTNAPKRQRVVQN